MSPGWFVITVVFFAALAIPLLGAIAFGVARLLKHPHSAALAKFNLVVSLPLLVLALLIFLLWFLLMLSFPRMAPAG